MQPNAVIENNRHEKPLPGEDLQGFEQDLPGENTTGFNTTTIYGLPIQVCLTINDHWGYSRNDQNTKSVRRLVHVLAKSAAVDGNLLLNVGPTPEGEIMPVHAERLRGVGRWLADNGAAIYGARASAIPATRETVITRRGNAHYVHVLDYNSDCVILSGVPRELEHARLLHTGRALTIERDAANFFVSDDPDRALIYLPPETRDPLNTVIELS